MSTMLNIIAVLCFITAFVLYGIPIVRAHKRERMKRVLFAKGSRKLWWIGSAFLVAGVICHAAANQIAPNNNEARERAATIRALSGPGAN